MTQGDNKPYDLEQRAEAFARAVRVFVKRLPDIPVNWEDIKQVLRSSGSAGSNYIEANEALGKKDFLMRIRICRKEAKESGYWLRLLDVGGDAALEQERQALVSESVELMMIFGAILRRSEDK